METATTTVDAYLELLKNKKVKAGSAHGLRNETRRQGNHANKLGKIKTDVNRSSVLLLPMELAFKFDVTVGEETEEFHSGNEWRLPKRASFTAKVVKAIADKTPATKERLMQEAGVSDWDTSDSSVLTKEDMKVFRPHRIQRVYSRPVVYIKSQTITGRDNGVAFSANIRKNEAGKLIDEQGLVLSGSNSPKWAQIMDIESARNFQEWLDLSAIRTAAAGGDTEWKTKIKKWREEYDGIDLSSIPDDKFRELRGAVMGDVLISDDRMLNQYIVFEIETEAAEEPKEKAHFKNPAERFLDGLQKISGRPKKMSELLVQLEPGGKLVNKDVNFDYIEMYRQCPSTYTGPENDKKIMLLASQTSYSLPPTPIKEWVDANNDNAPIGQQFLDKLFDFMDEQGDLEDRYIVSTGLDEFNPFVEEQLEEVFSQSGILKSPYLTAQIMRRHSRFLEEVFGDEFTDLATEMELGIKTMLQGQEADVEKATEVRKESLGDSVQFDEAEVGAEETEEEPAPEADTAPVNESKPVPTLSPSDLED